MLTFEDISPYLDNARSYDADLLTRVRAFVERMGFERVRAWNTANANSGSCLGITVLLDRDWRTTLDPDTPMWLAPYKFSVFISARGPLVTSDGYEWVPTLPGERLPPGEDRGLQAQRGR